ncbi:MAG: NAD(P)-binding domain-containing protein [Planctomycetota bacterium]|nr:NAD(P)-binding domain-containing protein [Planctomycetota bacterium]
MNGRSIGFVGGGRITRIILEGWQKAGVVPAQVVVSDASDAPLAKLKQQWPQVRAAVNGNAEAAGQDIVFLAVHPPVLADVAAQIKASLQSNAILVSLAPKFTISKLSQLLGGFARIARVIPNAPTVVGAGFNPIAFAPDFSDTEKRAVLDLWAPLGDCPQVAEDKLEAYAILTAMGPTYFWYQFYELCGLAESFGLTSQEANTGLEKMVTGAIQTMLHSGLSAEQVKDLIPVKPLGEAEASMVEMYRTRLAGVMQKIKP